MTTDQLHDLIDADTTAKQLANSGADGACAVRCTEIAPKVTRRTLIGELGIIALYANPSDAETVLGKFETVALSNPVVKRVLKWIQPGAPGIDFGDARIRGLLTTAVISGGIGLTSGQAAPLLAAAEYPQEITAQEVSEAWARYRAGGRIG